MREECVFECDGVLPLWMARAPCTYPALAACAAVAARPSKACRTTRFAPHSIKYSTACLPANPIISSASPSSSLTSKEAYAVVAVLAERECTFTGRSSSSASATCCRKHSICAFLRCSRSAACCSAGKLLASSGGNRICGLKSNPISPMHTICSRCWRISSSTGASSSMRTHRGNRAGSSGESVLAGCCTGWSPIDAKTPGHREASSSTATASTAFSLTATICRTLL